jgi:drug/metabolite transporter (DMT)-like permease
MIEGILLALSAALIYGFLGVVFELAGKRQYKVWDFILVKQFVGLCIGSACAALLRLPFLDWQLLGLGVIGAVAYVITLAAYLIASREKNIAANWTIVNLSVVVPILLSIVWFGDRFSLTKSIGIILTVLSIVLIGRASSHTPTPRKTSKRWFMCIALAFLLNGVLVILFRFVPEREGALFTAYFYGISFLFVAPYKLLVDRQWKPAKGLISVSSAGALAHWMGIMLTIAALAHIGRVSKETGVIVYPITNGLVIPVGVVLGVMILKQRVDRRTAVGVALGALALVCLLVK